MSKRHLHLVETKEMGDETDDQKQMVLVNKALKFTELYDRDDEGNYINIFDLSKKIPEEYKTDIKSYYEINVKEFVNSYKQLPQFPQFELIKRDLMTRKIQYALGHVDTVTKKFENPFKRGETLEFNADPNEEIPEIVKTMFMQEINKLGLDDADFHNDDLPSNYTYRDHVLQDGKVTSTSHVTPQIISPENSIGTPEKQLKNQPENKLHVNKLPYSLTSGDATNPNTLLAYYYLKMRDYLRTLRRFTGFVKFYQGIEKEHTFITIRQDANNVEIDLNHMYSTMHGKTVEEKDRLKRYMNVEDIQSAKKSKIV